MPWLIAALLVLWAVFGHPKKDLENAIWPESAAPWEEVDCYAYDGATVATSYHTAKSEDACRIWLSSLNNRRLRLIIGIGPHGEFAGDTLYRVKIN